MKKISYLLSLVLTGVLVSCQYDFPEIPSETPEPGEADFSKLITVGSSITSGIMDGALYDRGQQHSFSVILAEQLKEVGGGDFNVPEINSEVGFFAPGPGGIPLGRLILRINPNTGQVAPSPIVPGEPLQAYAGDRSAINNFGVNALTLGAALIPETGDPSQSQHPAFNPHYARFARNPGSSTVIGDAAAALADQGTFFTFWLGKFDILAYAVTGGANPALLTSDGDFTQRYNLALGSLLQANPEAKGAVANIPNLNAIPYFTTVPWNAFPLTAAQANMANSAYQDYNGGIAQAYSMGAISEEEKDLRTIFFEAGQNGFVMEDETLTDLREMGLPSIRQSHANDRATLTLSTVLGQSVEGNPSAIRGLTVPITDEFVLIPSEQQEVQAKITTFNNVINSAVQANNERLVLVDVNEFFEQVREGIINAGGVPLTASLAPPNGAFSVDGVHPNARANAFLANYFIEAINQKWSSSIPKVNPNAYMGNDLPR
ncbi:hypothetical protein [Negadavirga shengliensis]|uniref:GDSL-like lipase/acylhydrolase family protein n=1 Tax=Negadavirga shengliensis TaxID=1389218 RepID=A0ABV9SZJ6_9BACT